MRSHENSPTLRDQELGEALARTSTIPLQQPHGAHCAATQAKTPARETHHHRPKTLQTRRMTKNVVQTGPQSPQTSAWARDGEEASRGSSRRGRGRREQMDRVRATAASKRVDPGSLTNSQTRWRGRRRVETRRSRGREDSEARWRKVDRRRGLTKMISAPPRVTTTYLEHPQSPHHHSLHLTNLRNHRTNPRVSSSRGRGERRRTSNSDLPVPKRTCRDRLQATRILGTCRRRLETRQKTSANA